MRKTYKKKNKRNRKNKTFKHTICSPNQSYGFTCYSKEALYKLKTIWNKRHPEQPIKSNNPRTIWLQLKDYQISTCQTEACWLKQEFMKHNLDKDLLNSTFAPKAPITWKKNPNEWLSSIDISKVMKQYENKFPNFKFIGPSPIDFATIINNNNCVWPELCSFNILNIIKHKKDNIGIIFNLDPHYKSGSHWVAIYISIPYNCIIYWDSVAEKEPPEINLFVKNIQKQGKDLNQIYKYSKNTIEHQKLNTECGIYCLYFLTSQLRNGKPHLFNKRISDKEITMFRKYFFNVE